MVTNQRKFVIQVLTNHTFRFYIKKVYKNRIGYFYTYTRYQKKAMVWKFKKNCQNAILRIENNLDPTKHNLKSNNLKLLEITNNQILRNIKLKKIKKKNL